MAAFTIGPPDTVSYDHMIQNRDPQQTPRGSETSCHGVILSTWGRVSTRVVVNDDHRGSSRSQCWPEDLPWVHKTCAQCSSRDFRRCQHPGTRVEEQNPKHFHRFVAESRDEQAQNVGGPRYSRRDLRGLRCPTTTEFERDGKPMPRARTKVDQRRAAHETWSGKLTQRPRETGKGPPILRTRQFTQQLPRGHF